jgi:hypothetical protein
LSRRDSQVAVLTVRDAIELAEPVSQRLRELSPPIEGEVEQTD